jgi:hypothetical protein
MAAVIGARHSILSAEGNGSRKARPAIVAFAMNAMIGENGIAKSVRNVHMESRFHVKGVAASPTAGMR